MGWALGLWASRYDLGPLELGACEVYFIFGSSNVRNDRVCGLDSIPPWEDTSEYPTLPCDSCGALVPPEVEVYETGFGVDWAPSGSFVKWACKRCGHVRMSPISADVTEEELRELERQEEDFWRLQHQEDEY